MGHESRLIAVKELPQWLQRGLRSAGYVRPEVRIEGTLDVSVSSCGGDGYRDYVHVTHEDGRASLHLQGSYGGPNAFSQNRVDGTDPKYGRDERMPLERGMAIITGSTGGNRPTSATIALHPTQYLEIMPARTNAVTAWEITVLNAYSMKAGRYRDDEFMRPKCEPHGQVNCYQRYCISGRKTLVEDTTTTLVERGLLKRTKAGAVSLTTAGKNARQSEPLTLTVGDEMHITAEAICYVVLPILLSLALDARRKLEEKCWICDSSIGDGDEPGHVPMDNGVMVPVCSVACTNVHFALDVESEVAS